jgi:hypothetical protein
MPANLSFSRLANWIARITELSHNIMVIIHMEVYM